MLHWVTPRLEVIRYFFFVLVDLLDATSDATSDATTAAILASSFGGA